MYLDASDFGAGQTLGTRDGDFLADDIYIDDVLISSSRWWVKGEIYVDGYGYEDFSIYYYGKNMDSSKLSRVTINSIDAHAEDLGTFYISDLSYTVQDALDKTEFELQLDLLSGKDTIYGTSFDDVFATHGGDDLVYGGGGNDWIYGENGNDRLHGGPGSDHLEGRTGDDKIYGDGGDDVIKYLSGNDEIDGGSGWDQLIFTVASNDVDVSLSGSVYEFVVDGNSVSTIDVEWVKFSDKNLGIDEFFNSSMPSYKTINFYARDLVGDVLTGSTQFSHNSFDSKFYNLGEGRYGVQKKGESTIDEITGVTSLQFADQALSLANDVAATFNQVKGIDDVSGVVFRLYNAAFARLPDANGLENWINGNSSGGMTYATSAQEFSSSQEFKNRYGANTTDTQYITTLYNNVLERSPDKAGLANYQNLLANGKERGALLLDFSESPENRGLFTEVTGLS